MLSANSAKAYGHLKVSALSKLYGQAAITHSAWPTCGSQLHDPGLAVPVVRSSGPAPPMTGLPRGETVPV